MKILQRVQMNLASLGHPPKQSPFNRTQLWIFAKNFLSLVVLFAYLIREPKTSKEYVVSIYITSSTVLVNIARVSTLLKNETIFQFIDAVKSTLNKSELNFE